jgi:hypothetical protein
MMLSLLLAGAGLAWGEEASFGPFFAHAQPPSPTGRYVAGMEVLTDQPTFLGHANADLMALHASTVYLYVAYHGEAFFPLPPLARRAGLTEVADLTGPIVRAFHQEHFKVVLVVSSALLNWSQATPIGRSMLQPDSGVIDPRGAATMVEGLVRVLSRYHPDGIYVGEPFTWPGDPFIPASAWVAFYQELHAVTSVPLVMLLPTDRDEFSSIYKTYGSAMDTALARSHLFSVLGIDGEGMVPRTKPSLPITGKWATESPLEFAVASRRLGGAHAVDEIPITNPLDLGTALRLSLMERAIRAAGGAGDQGIVIFSDEYLPAYDPAQQAELGRLLQAFLNGYGMRSRAASAVARR